VNFQEYIKLDGTAIANLVNKKEVTAKEIIEIAIKRIEAVNPEVNAVIYQMFDEAKKVIDTNNILNKPFSGVPLLLKDLLGAYKGYPLSNGSISLKRNISQQNSEMVDRYLSAGTIILGKTNTPEFGIMGVTEPKAFGPTRNPWNLQNSPGGSSGGSAAAIAAGIVPIASGGDGGGSIRIPASFCGLYGMKPTRGRTPNGPHHGSLWEGATVQHIISRSVRDSARMLDITSASFQPSPYSILPNTVKYEDIILRSPSKLKIGFTRQHPLGEKIDPDCLLALEDSIKKLESLGHHLEETSFPINGAELAKSYITMVCGQVSAEVEELDASFRNQLELTTQTLALIGNNINATEYITQKNKWHKFSQQLFNFHQNYDLLLTPTTATSHIKVGQLAPKTHEDLLMKVVNKFKLGKLVIKTGLIDKLAHESLSLVPFTQIANLTGVPAVSLPLFWNSNNLPVGVQLIGKWGDESTLFQISKEVEDAYPWFNNMANI
jgi:amidase